MVVLVALAVPAGSAAAATLTDTASATVGLDAPGTLLLDQFDPALGTLTEVRVSITATALVQSCVENMNAEAGATAGGSATGSLDAAFPGGTARAAASAEATGPAAALAASNGTAECSAAFDTVTGRFATEVSAADVTFFQQSDQVTNSATLNAAAQLSPFVGTGTIAVGYTTNNDTALVLPPEWQNTAVAQGRLEATVTYRYTVPGQLPDTGGDSSRIVTLAGVAVVTGIVVLLFSRHRRTRRFTTAERP